VDEVNLVFTVTDSKHQLRSGLSAADLRFLDNQHAPEKIQYFQQQSSLPLHLALLIDTSSSVEKRFGFEKKAATVFLQKMIRPGLDQALLIAFDDEVHLVHDFSDDLPAIRQSLKPLKPGGNTALYDAVLFAADKLKSYSEASVTRRVIIIITDGEDTKGHSILYDAEQAAIRADSVLFALSTNQLNSQSRYPRGEAVLELLSRATGGGILPAHGRSEINHAFRTMEKTLLSQYVVGYTPAGFKADGSFHTVEILPRDSRLHVQCRRGYYATEH
jgi:VWFA-related protein